LTVEHQPLRISRRGAPPAREQPAVLGTRLHRPAEIVALEKRLDADASLGVCHAGASVLPDVDSSACQPQHFLTSPFTGQPIDVWHEPLAPASRPAAPSLRREPSGGQEGARAGAAAPQVALFVLAAHGGADTAQCLLEAFRTAGEATSLEMHVVSGPHADLGPAHAVAGRLQEHFGVTVHLRRAAPGAPRAWAGANSSAGAALGGAGRRASGSGQLLAAALEAAAGAAAAAAGAQYVAVLEDSVLPAPGWLAALLASLEQQPAVGLMSPAVLNGRYRLHSAGASLATDGSLALEGHCQQLAAEHGYQREVAAASAEALLFRGEMLSSYAAACRAQQQCGAAGPDAGGGGGAGCGQYDSLQFAAADVALFARAAGWKVRHQPLSVVFKRGSGGACRPQDAAAGGPASDRQLLLSRWHNQLAGAAAAGGAGGGPEAARQRRVLWVDDVVPEPDRDSGSVRTLALLRFLLEAGHSVSFLPAWDQNRPQRYALQVRQGGGGQAAWCRPLCRLWPLGPGPGPGQRGAP
jgi:hypothetical protein